MRPSSTWAGATGPLLSVAGGVGDFLLKRLQPVSANAQAAAKKKAAVRGSDRDGAEGRIKPITL